MRFLLLKIVFFLFTCIYIPLQAAGWSANGHRIVGGIADHYLSGKARAAIKRILGNESVAMSSTWADFIKSDTAYRYLNSWHYVNFAKGLSYQQFEDSLRLDPTPNIYNRIQFLSESLRNKSLPAEQQLFYLRLLIHFVGDLHQPLHVSPAGSTGGNDIRVSWFSQSSNLHRVWDDHLIDYQQLSYTEYITAINFTTKEQRKAWQRAPIQRWAFESYTISQQLHEELKEPNMRLGYDYNFRHVNTLNQQLLKGGVRLAGLLNDIFD